MKIDFKKVDMNMFSVQSVTIEDEECYLINPARSQFPKWTKENLIFRSSMWNSKGEAISLSYKKFFNWDESLEVTPQPKELNKNSKIKMVEKMDGSTLIISKYKGNLIIRTRGTVSYETLPNAFEMDFLKSKYPKVFNFDDEDKTFIYEWVSPFNRIILNYGEDPDIYLTACISHEDYSLMDQDKLDLLAKDLDVKRPRRFDFSSVDDMLNSISVLKGQEGICVYFNNYQDIRKVKSSWYLALHRLKSELSSMEKVVDLFFVLEKPSYVEFYNYIFEAFDFELAEQCKGQISIICDGFKEVLKIIDGMKSKVEEVKDLTRKEAALIILGSYGDTNRAGIVFSLLDKKELQVKDFKRLLLQVIKH